MIISRCCIIPPSLLQFAGIMRNSTINPSAQFCWDDNSILTRVANKLISQKIIFRDSNSRPTANSASRVARKDQTSWTDTYTVTLQTRYKFFGRYTIRVNIHLLLDLAKFE